MTDTESTTGAGPDSPGLLRRGATSLRRPRVLVVAVVAVVLLGALTSTGLRLREHVADESARASALEAATRYATDLSTYDHRHLDAHFAAVTAHAHGQFAQQYKQVSASLTELIRQNEALSQGTVLTSAAVEADQDRAVIALFVDQEVTNKNTPQPRLDRNRMRMTLVRQDDRWLIDGIELL
ncbi:hypothetical protein EIL87_19985 [Saccharopolyspora rhizosphaerae]|uniref:Mce-associated membrane protein n=1 Tax=Saccharopolyspora rhizosphaerae TaxID=2492662 RepID=A0A426JMM8_9PSEU|nr:hypothetical protein [Saccharopolyspora rhizosphaerae]RRO14463.1 hypothetical protein EIL87_19985 [Saccharopolyspora rhizosphaerae]